MLRQAYANECSHILGGKQRAVFKNRPSEFFRNSDGFILEDQTDMGRKEAERVLEVSLLSGQPERLNQLVGMGEALIAFYEYPNVIYMHGGWGQKKIDCMPTFV